MIICGFITEDELRNEIDIKHNVIFFHDGVRVIHIAAQKEPITIASLTNTLIEVNETGLSGDAQILVVDIDKQFLYDFIQFETEENSDESKNSIH